MLSNYQSRFPVNWLINFDRKRTQQYRHVTGVCNLSTSGCECTCSNWHILYNMTFSQKRRYKSRHYLRYQVYTKLTHLFSLTYLVWYGRKMIITYNKCKITLTSISISFNISTHTKELHVINKRDQQTQMHYVLSIHTTTSLRDIRYINDKCNTSLTLEISLF